MWRHSGAPARLFASAPRRVPRYCPRTLTSAPPSRSWILGVSLGDARTLRLERREGPPDVHELALPSGSVYVQRCVSRRASRTRL